ncbi:hypothetical protein V1478_007438 [Vespula squamosa]|uniref:Uncharacterized protein n=1 Tax=Vespula squamosa TaxID=30214 RepID=A0ABD2B361_VESSQ
MIIPILEIYDGISYREDIVSCSLERSEESINKWTSLYLSSSPASGITDIRTIEDQQGTPEMEAVVSRLSRFRNETNLRIYIPSRASFVDKVNSSLLLNDSFAFAEEEEGEEEEEEEEEKEEEGKKEEEEKEDEDEAVRGGGNQMNVG